jgi:hypothetical protein
MSVAFLVPEHMTVAQHYLSHIAFGSEILLIKDIQSIGEFLNSPMRYMILETRVLFDQ